MANSKEAFLQRCWAAGDALLQGKHPVVPFGINVPEVLKQVSDVVNYDVRATDHPENACLKVWGERLADGSVRLHIKQG